MPSQHCTPTGRTPSWPSLYNPGLEILNIEHRNPTQPCGYYLYHPKDIFRFTLYWTLIFYIPIFIVCGTFAFWNYAFPPYRHIISHSMAPLLPPSIRRRAEARPVRPLKLKERRSRLAFAMLVLLTFLTLSVAGAVIGSAILGFALSGFYNASHFNMSTWIPFLLAVLQVVIGLLSIWPSIIDIV